MKLNKKQIEAVNCLKLLGKENKKFKEQQQMAFDKCKINCPQRKKFFTRGDYACKLLMTQTYAGYCRMGSCPTIRK